ncbi:MAG: hypothetical protein H7323_02820 [Frankiales bacterium]|nr:hypothetical protein [Frankiales bacterium]
MRRRSTQELAVRRASELVETVGERAGVLAQDLTQRAGPLRDRVFEGAGELAETAGPLVGAAAETVSGVLEEARERGGAAWDVLRGERVGPPLAVRRWPWALGAAVAGAVAGAVAVKLLRTIAPADAPGAQAPHELRAVVDTPTHDVAPGNGRPTPAPPVTGGTFEL